MDKKVILGGVVGAIVILAFAFSILLIINSFFPGLISGANNLLIGLIPFLLAPVAGGFLAGLIGRQDPLKSGLMAGVIASLIVFIAWLVIAGLSLETILSGLVIVFVWVVLARIAAGFAQPRLKS
jgi:hypothetical protein